MADTVEGYAKRPVGYMYVDGIYEMFIGIVLFGDGAPGSGVVHSAGRDRLRQHQFP